MVDALPPFQLSSEHHRAFAVALREEHVGRQVERMIAAHPECAVGTSRAEFRRRIEALVEDAERLGVRGELATTAFVAVQLLLGAELAAGTAPEWAVRIWCDASATWEARAYRILARRSGIDCA